MVRKNVMLGYIKYKIVQTINAYLDLAAGTRVEVLDPEFSICCYSFFDGNTNQRRVSCVDGYVLKFVDV